MIKLTRFNGTAFYLNITHIETVEATPDTVITLFNDRKYIVKDSIESIAERVQAFYQNAHPIATAPKLPDDLNE
ncbi:MULTISPECIES: flagellar FlbD family protein [Brevibacillus]|jgi:flagellar protein FlbD|uniref:Endoflagellar protein n=1 Tax=Brevibacillus parabrevis TaxID=54914 RepID=A0A4Y3P965_BREPA|nr:MULTISPECIES: flagellar FlbD family protein [Brevibacillus]MBU8711407.1 flagellar FlbD family protein [Brevibacillus parabrevis]MDH6349965.1 flagellar protein FlbD [Brevibacillus sp. 1238]MDR4999417.1 flagellar FlbD family protein [Brevibacillus parabrevis]MED1721716.1 flagellar FlbD family protein [Brevibacillus parabrevis]MED2254022.1 flagellar FlbD family protein [Brevibacillus parabrevis]